MTTPERLANLSRVSFPVDDGLRMVRQVDAAKALGVTRQAVRNWERRGLIRAFRVEAPNTSASPNRMMTLYRLDQLKRRAQRMRFRHYWTEQDDQWLRDNYGKLSIEECARHFGCSYDAVVSRARVYNLTYANCTTDYKLSTVARMLGVKADTARYWCRQGGLKHRRLGHQCMVMLDDLVRFLARKPTIASRIKPERIEWVRHVAGNVNQLEKAA